MVLELGDRCQHCDTGKHSDGWGLREWFDGEGRVSILLCPKCLPRFDRRVAERGKHRADFEKRFVRFYKELHAV